MLTARLPTSEIHLGPATDAVALVCGASGRHGGLRGAAGEPHGPKPRRARTQEVRTPHVCMYACRS
jgi:hypothetical protein